MALSCNLVSTLQAEEVPTQTSCHCHRFNRKTSASWLTVLWRECHRFVL